MTADMSKEQTFFFFFFVLFVPDCSHLLPSQVHTVHATYCHGFEIAANVNGNVSEIVVHAVLQIRIKSGDKKKKIHRLQTDSVMIAPPGMGCIPVSRHQDFNSHRAHKVLTWKRKLPVPGAEMPKA